MRVTQEELTVALLVRAFLYSRFTEGTHEETIMTFY